ncbi:MAG: ribosome recycling factor [Clostridia bacterium]|nr:ribosome recycling factor [Clostridia bacterium]MBR4979402.1 ribosome recycling factor [Clostridia bacterium]
MKIETKEYEEKMAKTLAGLESEFKTISAGKASAGALDRIQVEYFGSKMPINQLAEIKIPDPRTLVISPWDSSVLKSIEKAIQTSDLGINPQNDGKLIRLAFPQPTEERRKELAKKVERLAEEFKVAVRNVRRDANEKAKDMKKNSEMTEDELKASEKLIQDLTDKYIKNIDTAAENKKKEIMSI